MEAVLADPPPDATDRERFAWHVLAGRCHRDAAALEDARRHLVRASELATVPARQALVRCDLGALALLRSDADTAAEHYEAAHRIAREHAIGDALIDAAANLATVALRRRQLGDAERWGRIAVAAAASRDVELTACWLTLGLAAALAGDAATARARLGRIVRDTDPPTAAVATAALAAVSPGPEGERWLADAAERLGAPEVVPTPLLRDLLRDAAEAALDASTGARIRALVAHTER